MHYLGQCDKIRKNESGEKFWDYVMNTKNEIDGESEFLLGIGGENVFKAALLDKDETFESWLSYNKDALFYVYLVITKANECVYVYFVQTCGFEFFFCENDKITTLLC